MHRDEDIAAKEEVIQSQEILIEEVKDINEVPNMAAHIRNHSVKKFCETCSQNSEANGEFNLSEVRVSVPERYES